VSLTDGTRTGIVIAIDAMTEIDEMIEVALAVTGVMTGTAIGTEAETGTETGTAIGTAIETAGLGTMVHRLYERSATRREETGRVGAETGRDGEARAGTSAAEAGTQRAGAAGAGAGGAGGAGGVAAERGGETRNRSRPVQQRRAPTSKTSKRWHKAEMQTAPLQPSMQQRCQLIPARRAGTPSPLPTNLAHRAGMLAPLPMIAGILHPLPMTPGVLRPLPMKAGVLHPLPMIAGLPPHLPMIAGMLLLLRLGPAHRAGIPPQLLAIAGMLLLVSSARRAGTPRLLQVEMVHGCKPQLQPHPPQPGYLVKVQVSIPGELRMIHGALRANGHSPQVPARPRAGQERLGTRVGLNPLVTKMLPCSLAQAGALLAGDTCELMVGSQDCTSVEAAACSDSLG